MSRADKREILISIALGCGAGGLIYSYGAALLPSVVASVVMTGIVYVAFLPTRPMRSTMIRSKLARGYTDVPPTPSNIGKKVRVERFDTAVKPVEQVERRELQKITKINPEYYRPEVALSRFTPVNQTAIIGVGCAGINAVNHMVDSGVDNADMFSVDTDLQKLHHSKSDCNIFIGDEKGRVAELIDEAMKGLEQTYQQADTVILLVGMGGKTGTVAAPMLARAAKAAGKIVHLFAIEPFSVEGGSKKEVAASVLKGLESEVDSVVSLSNDELDELFTSDGNMVAAFNTANEVWRRLVADAVAPEVSVH